MHLKPIFPLTIEMIRAHRWCGNAWSDGPAFDSIHKFVIDESNSVADRAEALRIMGRDAMGLEDDGVSDAAAVARYLQDAS